MKILIVGDVHGRLINLYDVINNSRQLNIDAVIQCGDFGFWQSVFAEYYGTIISHKSRKFALPVYVIDGNHEDHKWLHNQNKKDWAKYLNIHFMERATVKRFGESIIAFLGGALNVDRSQTVWRRKRKDPYLYDNIGIHNFTLNSEKNELLTKLNNMGESVDLIVTHTCPDSIGVGMPKHLSLMGLERKYIGIHNISTGPKNDCGEPILKDLWNQLKFKPKHWVFAHFHTLQQKLISNTTFTCVGCVDNSDGKMGVLPFVFDTETKKIEAFPDIRL